MSAYLKSLTRTRVNIEKKKKAANRLPSVVAHMGNDINMKLLTEQNSRKRKDTQENPQIKAKKSLKFDNPEFPKSSAPVLSPSPSTSGLSTNVGKDGIPVSNENGSDSD